MKKEKLLPFSILTGISILLVFFAFNQPYNLPTNVAYIETGLITSPEYEVSIIVTARSSDSAARAIETIGGEVTSNLWLIDAVAARVPAEKIERLAKIPGILSIVFNKTLHISEQPPDDPLPPDSFTITTDYSGSGFTATCDHTLSWATGTLTGSTSCSAEGLETDKSWPVGVDVGADTVHEVGITGDGITVALVDTGVFYSDDLFFEGEPEYVINLLGQADFVGSGSCPDPFSPMEMQLPAHCFALYGATYDGYGHGTHLAGTIAALYKDSSTQKTLGIAPDAQILSVRALDENGQGTYEDVIECIQYIIETKEVFNTRVMNLSLSAAPTTPYFVDPLNRAVEKAWLAGIVVVAAAGNIGPNAQTITVPGNDPYIITVGGIDTRQTAGDWPDDVVPSWSSTGPTLDNFLKPDVLAPGGSIVSYLYNNPENPEATARLALIHPDYTESTTWFRLNGTSVSAAVTSGVVALMLQENPALTPNEVKARLMASAKQLSTDSGELGYNLLTQGAGRIWAPDAIFGEFPADTFANADLDLENDLANGWGTYDDNGLPVLDETALEHHYLGPVRSLLSEDGQFKLFYAENGEGSGVALGVTENTTNAWMRPDDVPQNTIWSLGNLVWSGGNLVWSGGQLSWSMGPLFDSSGIMVWSGGVLTWNPDGLFDANGNMVWSGEGLFDTSGNMVWSGGEAVWDTGTMKWAGSRMVWYSEALFDTAGNMVWGGGSMFWYEGYLADLNGSWVWQGGPLFNVAGNKVWSGGNMVWSGGNIVWSGGNMVWSGGSMVWSGGGLVGAGGNMAWSGGNMVWSGGNMVWSGGNMVWSGGNMVWSGGNMVWSGTAAPSETAAATLWVDDLAISDPIYPPGEPIDPISPPEEPVAPPPPVVTPVFSVRDIDAIAYPDGRSKWRADISITVLDASGAPIVGAVIVGHITGSRNRATEVTCVTDPTGQCTVTSQKFQNSISEATFHIENIVPTDPSTVYEPEGNTDPDGDSDGTTLITGHP